MAQRLDQTGPSHSVVDGVQFIAVLKFKHAAMASRGQVEDLGQQRAFRWLCFQPENQPLCLINQRAESG